MTSAHVPGQHPSRPEPRLRIDPGALPDPRRTSPEAQAERRKLHTTPVQHAAKAVAVVFGLVGLLGFLPGITTNIGALEFAGHHSEAMLFGLFAVSVLHNVVHLLFAVTGLAFATTPGAARGFLVGGGLVYLLLALFGLLVGEDSTANFIPVNAADDWLHLGLAGGMIALGLLLSSRMTHEDDTEEVSE